LHRILDIINKLTVFYALITCLNICMTIVIYNIIAYDINCLVTDVKWVGSQSNLSVWTVILLSKRVAPWLMVMVFGLDPNNWYQSQGNEFDSWWVIIKREIVASCTIVPWRRPGGPSHNPSGIPNRTIVEGELHS